MALLVGRAAAVVIAAFTALVVAAVPASATVFVAVWNGETLGITSNSAGDTITVTCAGGSVKVENASTPSLACDDMTSMFVNANGGTDTVDLSGVTLAEFPQFAEASVDVSDTFADVVSGTQGRDVITADEKDTVTTAGAGDDFVEGAATASGGEGDDVLRDIADEAQGGAGNDWIGGAGTASGGEGDDVLRDIADEVEAGSGNDRIVDPGGGPFSGGDGHDVLVQDYTADSLPRSVVLTITDTLLGPPGFGVPSTGIEQYHITTSTGVRNDSIDSSAYSGVLIVETLDGNDTVRGGLAADVVDGGAGNDALDPGLGADVVRGGSGNDAISVRDGVADSVDCGDGSDTVVADRADVLTGCESVALPPPETNQIVGPKKVKKGKKPAFTFGSPAAGAQFECAIDGNPFKPCESPYHVKTRKLHQGKHTLSVRAIQPAGNADPTPSTFRFKVLPKNK